MTKSRADKSGELIFDKIRQRIINWEYPPKHPLREEALSMEFGVSRSPVRKALYMLEAGNYIFRIPNRGYFVKPVQKREITELYELRSILELAAAEFILENAGLSERLAALREPWERAREAERLTGEDLAFIDQEFHAGLVGLMDNSMLDFYFGSINERLFRFRVMDFDETLNSKAIEEVADNHMGIVDALSAGHREEAVGRLKANIAEGLRNVDISLGRALMRTYEL
ncbi:GntR family transcriptional regulator [Pseudodesulfovibrio indicus]|uniref:GntR family transcriptional regulator n=1 Tax=Pseudodesulfovibrio indicus TaxID=1716143 RepID=UPI00292CF528|nr:GntR family transcriptional regulator [Pseudodesulfovibrio indicus]